MRIEHIEKMKSLKSNANALKLFHEMYSQKYESDKNCDKKGYGFNKDDRFAAFKVTVTFDTWKGYYGNSSCSTILSITDKDAVTKAFVEAINQNHKLIFATMAKLMLAEAESMAGKAKEELAALQSLIAEFDAPDTSKAA